MLTVSKEELIADRLRLGAELKRHRLGCCMKLKCAASLAGIHPSNLSRIEQGNYSIGFDTLNTLLRIYNIEAHFWSFLANALPF